MAEHVPSDTQNEIGIAQRTSQSPAETSIQMPPPPNESPNLSQRQVHHGAGFLLSIIWFIVVLFIGVPLLVILGALIVALTLLMLFQHGEDYDKAARVKFIIRFWIGAVAVTLALAVTLFALAYRHFSDRLSLLLLGFASIFCLLCAIIFVNMILHTLVPPFPLESNESGVRFQEALFDLADCLLILLYVFTIVKWYPVSGQFNVLGQSNVLGLHGWIWTVALIFVVISYNLVRICTHLIAWSIKKVVNQTLDPAAMKSTRIELLVDRLVSREYTVYYCNGLKSNITFILCSFLTLMTWVLYFVPRLSKTPKVNKITHFANQTCLSVFVCSILWLFKTCVILSWETNAMYTRLRCQILDSTKQLYFLGIIGRHNQDIFKLNYYKQRGSANRVWQLFRFQLEERNGSNSNDSDSNGTWQRILAILIICLSKALPPKGPESYNQRSSDKEDDELGQRRDDQFVKIMSAKKRKAIKYDLLMHNRTPTIHDIKQVAHHLISAKKALSNDTFVPSIMERLTKAPVLSEQLKQLLIEESNINAAPSGLSRSKNDASGIETLGTPSHPSGLPEGLGNNEFGTKNPGTPSHPNGLPERLENNESGTENPGAPSHPSGSSEGLENNEFGMENPGAPLLNENQNVNDVETSNSGQALNFTRDDWEHFQQEVLKDEECSQIFISTWLEKAQNNCLFLANALGGTKEVVDVLNKIVNSLLISATFIIWLFLTGLASLKIFVLIASPILVATVVFGDTCKTLFLGIIYVYVVHPIHVGDLCSIDDNQLVVKAVGLWITTFCKVEKYGSMEEVTYPNSQLAGKVVINNLTEFCWEDSLEIRVDSLQKSDAKELKQQIQGDLDLNENEDEFVPCTHSVVVQEEEDGDFKFILKLKYKISSVQDWSYTKCKRRKEKLHVGVDELVRRFKERQNRSYSNIYY